MATATLEIPEWTGSRLTLGAFTNYAKSVTIIMGKAGSEALALGDLIVPLRDAVNQLIKFVNKPSAYDETPAITKNDSKRDALYKALWRAWHYLSEVDEDDQFGKAALQIKPVMNIYKGIDTHELMKETVEIQGLNRDLSTEANKAAVELLGLDKILAELVVANTALSNAVTEREKARGERIADKGGESSASLRKSIVSLLVDCYRQINAANRIKHSETTEQVVQDINGVIAHYKLVAKKPHSQQDAPEPDPDPQPETDGASEPVENAV